MLIDFTKKIKKHIDVFFVLGYALLLLADIVYKHPVIERHNSNIILVSYCIMAVYILAQFIINKLYKPSFIFKNKKNAIYIVIAIIICFSYLKTKDATFIRILLISTCVFFMDFKKFIKADIILKVILISITLCLAFNKVIPNDVFYRENGFIRQALGFKNPNQLSLYLMVMLAEIMYLKSTKKNFLFLILAIMTIIVEYFVINTKTIIILIPAMIIFYFIYAHKYNFIEKVCNNKIIKGFIYIFPIILTVLMLVSITMYKNNPESIEVVDRLFSGRIRFSSIFYNEYKVSIFGSNIPDYIKGIVVLDNMYLKLLLKFGIIQYFIYMIILFANVKKAYKLKEYNVIFIITLLELYALMETITIIPTFNVFILYFEAGYFLHKKEENSVVKTEIEKETESKIDNELIQQNDLISIIIPIYNVEKYLRKCIESVINQTYKNLEIILIDDGSSDKSGEICDEYKKNDNRIIVIHKKNEGISVARNEGVKLVTGDYIGFVDSDDYIEPDMFEKLHYNAKKYNANISMCSYIDEYESGKTEMSRHFKDNITILSKIEALNNLILEQNLANHLWNKLFEKELFEGIDFPKGRKMEDVARTYKLFEKSNILVYDNYVGYHYLQHGDSIMGNVNLKLVEDTEKSIFEKNTDISAKYPELREATEIENIKTYKLLHYWLKLCGLNDLIESQKYKDYYKKYKKEYLKYRKQIKNNVGDKVILSYDLFWINKKLYFLYLKLNRRNG